MRKNRLLRIAGVTLFAVLVLGWVASRAGYWLVIDHPEKSDVIVVLDGDGSDHRYWQGITMLRRGYAQDAFIDGLDDVVKFGRTPAQETAIFIHETAGPLEPHVHVCPIMARSTVGETEYIRKCIEPLHPKRVLLVTSDYHTRRALAICRHKLPQYQWSVSAARDPREYGERWWTNREWAKTFLVEWQKLLWWKVVDRWTR